MRVRSGQELNPNTIWLEKQNKPTLVVKDLAEYAPPDVVYRSLLRRGVFKWLAARRDFIRLKDRIKREVTATIYLQKASTTASEKNYWKGYRAALEDCRADIRAICHSPRWRAPDFDRAANDWLRDQERQLRCPAVGGTHDRK